MTRARGGAGPRPRPPRPRACFVLLALTTCALLLGGARTRAPERDPAPASSSAPRVRTARALLRSDDDPADLVALDASSSSSSSSSSPRVAALGSDAVAVAVADADAPASASNASAAALPAALPAAHPLPTNDDGTLRYPNDITGTFKGTWRLIKKLGADGNANGTTGGLPGMRRAKAREGGGGKRRAGKGDDDDDDDDDGGGGVVVIQLVSRWNNLKTVQWTRADVAFRDGEYITQRDVHMRLDGVYVAPTGMTHLASEPSAGFRGAEATYNASDPADVEAADGGYREALRVAARDFVNEPFSTERAVALAREGSLSSRPEHVPGSPHLSQMRRKERSRRREEAGVGTYPGRCAFTMKTWVTPGSFKPVSDAFGNGGEFDEEDQPANGVEGVGVDGERARRVKSRRRRRRLSADKNTPPPSYDKKTHSAPGEGGRGDPEMTGILRSESCGVELAIDARWFKLGSYYRKATTYALMMAVAAPLQIYLLTRQGEHSDTNTGYAKLSLLCVGMQAVLDSYQCLMHLTAGIVVDALFHSFGAAAFLQFVLFSVFEMRTLLQIWKSRRPGAEQNWLEMRRDLSMLYTRFYAGFLAGFFIMYWCQKRPWIVAVVANSYWVPQILWNAWNNNKKPMHAGYVVGTSVIRLLLPLYVFGCPTNFIRIEPQYWVCLVLVSWVGAQVFALYAQHVRGPRCVFPESWFPPVYDYHRDVSEDVLASVGGGDAEKGDAGGVDCVICMATVECADRNQRVVTPCNHFFHEPCLTRWMEVKMECPTCRGALPPADF